GLAAGSSRSGRAWQSLHSELPPSAQNRCGLIFTDAAYRALHQGPDAKQAIALLQLAPWDVAREPLLALARGEDLPLRVAAINALAERDAPEVDALLLD